MTYGSTMVAECENSTEVGSTLPITPGARSRPLAPGILLVYGFIFFLDTCCQVLQPLVWSTSTSLGGLGFDPYRIGLIMGIWGFTNAIIQLTCLGPIIRRIGARNMLVVSLTFWVNLFALYPLLSFFAHGAGGADAKIWTILLIQIALSSAIYGAFGTSSLVSANTPLMRGI